MNAYQSAIDDNGFTIIDGTTYAIGTAPYIDNQQDRVVYKSFGFAEAMLDADGNHEPWANEYVTLVWDCTDWHNSETDSEFECDWEADAEIGGS